MCGQQFTAARTLLRSSFFFLLTNKPQEEAAKNKNYSHTHTHTHSHAHLLNWKLYNKHFQLLELISLCYRTLLFWPTAIYSITTTPLHKTTLSTWISRLGLSCVSKYVSFCFVLFVLFCVSVRCIALYSGISRDCFPFCCFVSCFFLVYFVLFAWIRTRPGAPTDPYQCLALKFKHGIAAARPPV